MAHSGKYKVKNKNKYQGNSDEVVYRSSWELRAFKWCDANPDVKKWSSEEVVIPYLYEADKRMHRYFIDLKIVFQSGSVLLVEIKPDKETKKPKYPGRKTKRYLDESFTFIKNQNKWKAAEKYAKDRGWKFEVWTENRLQQMGILPKPMKKLPSLKVKKKS